MEISCRNEPWNRHGRVRRVGSLMKYLTGCFYLLHHSGVIIPISCCLYILMSYSFRIYSVIDFHHVILIFFSYQIWVDCHGILSGITPWLPIVSIDIGRLARFHNTTILFSFDTDVQ